MGTKTMKLRERSAPTAYTPPTNPVPSGVANQAQTERLQARLNRVATATNALLAHRAPTTLAAAHAQAERIFAEHKTGLDFTTNRVLARDITRAINGAHDARTHYPRMQGEHQAAVKARRETPAQQHLRALRAEFIRAQGDLEAMRLDALLATARQMPPATNAAATRTRATSGTTRTRHK